jgi:hypothetical protein
MLAAAAILVLAGAGAGAAVKLQRPGGNAQRDVDDLG